MKAIVKLGLGVMLATVIFGCATGTHHYYDSALNDRNRAPASIGVPKSIGKESESIDVLSNQAQADFLFLKSELESNAGRGSETIDLLKNALVYDANSSTIMQRLAVEYYKQGNVTVAIEWAERGYEIDPSRKDLALLVAGLHTTNKTYTKAEEIYKKLVKQDKEDTESMLYLGAVYTELKNYPKAVEAFKSLTKVKGYSSKHLAHYYLARVYAEQSSKNVTRIKAELEQAIEVKPDFFEAVSMMAQYVQKESGITGAIKFYEKIQKEHGPLVKVAEVLSQYYITKNLFDLAYEQLELIDESGEDLVQVKLKMALILIDKKIYDRAISKLEEILEIAPESDKVRFYLSAVYEEKKEYRSALEQYLKIEKDSSYYEESRLHAAYISKLLGQVDDAVATLKEVVETTAENPQTFIFMSQLYEDKKDLAKSLVVLKTAEKKFADNATVVYYLGMLQDKMNLKTDMMVSMEKVIGIQPDHSQALNYLAYSWAEAGIHLEKAESYARQASNQEKDDAYILDTLGWVMYKKGDFKKAIEVLEKAHFMQPEVAIIAEHLGDAYFKLNMHEKAKAKFIKAEELEADDVRKKEIQQKVVLIENTIKNVRTPSSTSADLRPQESP